MNRQKFSEQSAPNPRRESGWGLLVVGLWLRAGFVGASAALSGLMLLFNADATPVFAMALAAGGTALAALAWRRARTVLDAAVDTGVDPADATSSAKAIAPAGGNVAAINAGRHRGAILAAE